MIKKELLKDLLQEKAFTRTEKMLICLAVTPVVPRAIKDIRAHAVDAGLRQAIKWNVSDLLRQADGLAVRTTEGWELTHEGRARIRDLTGVAAGSRTRKVATDLRQRLSSLASPNTKSFVEEAVECLEAGLYRAAIVFSWIGAVAVMQEYVVSNHLFAFNAEGARRDPKYRPAKTTDDLGRIKEYDFLQILAAISVIGNNVKQELEAALKLRNGCGHPNSLKIGEARTAAHVESLLLNVFSRFT